jgi:uncharacterized DUF497 family protein
VRYEWDSKKNAKNRRKHDGISFEVATLVFNDPCFLLELDRTDEYGEERWHATGMIQIAPDPFLVLLVVHVYREENDGQETIRIISARPADPDELRRYQEQKMD